MFLDYRSAKREHHVDVVGLGPILGLQSPSSSGYFQILEKKIVLNIITKY
jgi:hypothetical protein